MKEKLKNILKSKTKTISLITVILCSLSMLFSVYLEYDRTGQVDTNKISEAISTVVDEINKSSTEIPNLTETDEQSLEVQETESEGFEEQGIVAYEGSEKAPNIQLGEYAGLTYYSQLDNRWRSKMYSSVGNSSQTIGTSGCGPASAAMVVSSIKGNITPDQMAELYTKYGYRSANQGTYWSAFKWTADVFDIGYSECYKLDDVISKLKDNHYIIASCNQGLFTYGGHFIVLVGVEGDYIKVYDPYLYNGKFDVASRRGKATVSGNTVYVSIDNFRNYANYQKFFCFKNDRTDIKENTTTVVVTDNTTSNVNTVNYQVRITANGGLNIRTGASTSYARIGGYAKGSIVTILAESNGFGKTNLGWISLAYTSRDIGTLNIQNTVGNIKRLSRASILYSNSNLTGYKYNYKANTTITILQNISSNVDKVRVNVTGRIAYINNNNYINVTASKLQSVIRKTKACTLYSKSNLSGVRYQYKANTTVTVLQHINSYVDKVRVNATGRIAYINVNNYR
uniref:Peptidase n=1 Tax=Siphoviridae sp. ct5wd11 TaxID=2827781 RepID=A0A8S5SSC4_9CAUD|nr:MAG TPA: peptidase [Siphoviridae sp. ct5wd11]